MAPIRRGTRSDIVSPLPRRLKSCTQEAVEPVKRVAFASPGLADRGQYLSFEEPIMCESACQTVPYSHSDDDNQQKSEGKTSLFSTFLDFRCYKPK